MRSVLPRLSFASLRAAPRSPALSLSRSLALSLAIVFTACSPAFNRGSPAPTPGRSYTLGLAVPDAEREPWRSLAYGAREEAALHGLELWMSPTTGQSAEERQVRQIRELAGQGVNFLLIGGGEGPLVRPALEEAVARAVPLGALFSLVPVDLVIFKLGPDRHGLGRIQAECLGTALAGRGTVALLSGPRDELPSVEQARGFKETLRHQFPGLQLVAERAAPLDRSAATDQVATWLVQWPDLSGLAAGAEDPAIGALDALWQTGRLGRTKVATTGLGPPGEASLRDGGLHCAAMPRAVADGRAAVRNALAYLAHRPYQKSIVSPPLLLTRQNVDTIDWGLIRAP